ncbi:phage holin family protein [Devosia sp. BK]|uniref:phage holin family protein n=1 Tax=Devosia sp. BK TaxID=2871706 RepID=UPI00293AB528|nr:phage holin family protein [Devosia sp. BK]MDV3250026.1 phage holin family protein [Devosia sp. BK]
MFNLLMPLAGLLGLEVEGLGQRLKGLAVVYAVILVFGAIGVGFLIAAGYIALAASVGPLYASLIFAGGFIAIALITLIGFSMAEAGRKRRLVEKRRSSDTGAFLTTAALTALPLLARSPLLLKLGIPAAAIAAVALLRDRNDHNS